MADKVTHFEILGKDGKKLQKFYASLFDWKVDADNPMNYGMVSAEPGGIGGGIAQAQDKKPRVTFYVEVANLEESLKKAKKLGGKTMMEPSEVPGGPRIAIFKDPEGNAIGLVQAGSM